MAYIEDRLTAIESKLDAILAGLSKAAPAASASASETKKKGKPADKAADKPAEQPAATKGPDLTGDLERLRAALMAARDKGVSPKQLLSKLGFDSLAAATTREDIAKIEDALGKAIDPENDIPF